MSYVLFFIHLQTRKVVLGGLTASPDDAWMKQVARNVTGVIGQLGNARYLIRDRDAKYTEVLIRSWPLPASNRSNCRRSRRI